jgi:SET domain-containing protein
MEYFIDKRLYISHGKKGRGIYTNENIPTDTIIEYSPVIINYVTNWQETPYELKKMVFSFPIGTDNYVIGLGYTCLYNHDDKNNAYWYTDQGGVIIKTIRNVNIGEEVCIHYGDNYWSGGWPKY